MNRVAQWLRGPVADIVLRLIIVLSLAFGVVSYFGYHSLAACVAGYNNQSSTADKARADAAERDRAALDGFIFSLSDARTLPASEAKAQGQAAFDNYVRSRRETNEARAKNPLPPPPSEQCD